MNELLEADPSRGWEAVSAPFIADRERSTIGVAIVKRWSCWLPAGAAVVDVGCGPGGARSEVLHRRGFEVYAIDAAPSLAGAYRDYFPAARVACEPAESSAFFGRSFSGALAWGLLFLLPPETQEQVIGKVGRALEPSGHFLFTAPAEACSWEDISTGQLSVSLGERAYRAALKRAGLTLFAQYLDEGDNNYYASVKA